MSSQDDRYTFSTGLRRLLIQEPPAFAMAVKECLDEYLKQWKAAPPTKNVGQSAQQARQLHMIMDSEIAEFKEAQKPPVSCRQGCGHCCKMHVGVTSAEADLLAKYLQFSGRTVSTGTLQRQALYEGDDHWSGQPEADRTCVFLNSNQTCSVYPLRPMACRKHFVLSPAEDCNIENNPAGRTLSWIDVDAEILATAAMTHWPTGSLPAMLLAALTRLEQEREHVEKE